MDAPKKTRIKRKEVGQKELGKEERTDTGKVI